MPSGPSPTGEITEEELWTSSIASDIERLGFLDEDEVLYTDKIYKPAYDRIAFLRSTGRTLDGDKGVTPPYCPEGPTLNRVHRNAKRSKVKSKRSALGRFAPLSNLAPSPRVEMPQTGFQALILCGPGVSLNTFTSVPAEYPKALIPIANRPMVWYALDWCYRMGITSITLITPPQSQPALSAALSQNPHLTSLPSPSPTILAPPDLLFTTGTAELLQLPAVQAAITSDFLLLPCDLVCDVSGDKFLSSWMTNLGGLGGVTDGDDFEVPGPKLVGLGGEKGGRRGGLSVWYNTIGREESVKGEECDFNATVIFDTDQGFPPPIRLISSNYSELHGFVRKLVYAIPMDSLRDRCEAHGSQLELRVSLLKQYGSIKALSQYRDSHIYFFPYWVKDFARINEDFESVSEDLVGTWAKTEWRKPAYRARFGVEEVFGKRKRSQIDRVDPEDNSIEEEIDLFSLNSTSTTRAPPWETLKPKLTPTPLASRVVTDLDDSQITPDSENEDEAPPLLPPMLAYIHPSTSSAPLIRRVDTSPLLLSVSLLLAKDMSQNEASASFLQPSPHAHPFKIALSASIAPRTTITKHDCLIADNVTVAEKCVIKESVIGAGCSIGEGASLTKCLIMDGATVQEKCVLHGTIVGKKALIGKKSSLTNCQVQDGNAIPEGTDAKNDNFMIGGLEDEEAGSDFAGTGDDNGGEDDKDVFG